MTIMFKNGTTLKVSQEIVEILVERILSKEGAQPFQSFTNVDGVTHYVISVSEITYIKPE